MNNEKKSSKKRARYLLGLLILVVLTAVAGVVVWQMRQTGSLPFAQATAQASQSYQTSTVRRGSLAVTISGSGTVITAQTVDLGFSVAGSIAELSVNVGDTVTAGQVLARLDNQAELDLEVKNQELAVQTAQAELEDLLNHGDAALAQALSNQLSAEAAYQEAQNNLRQKGDPRCNPAKTQDLYFVWLYASQAADVWEGRLDDPDTGYGRDFILENLTPLRKKRDQAYANYTYCQGYTDMEIQQSEAALQLAKATFDQATAAYEKLKETAGVDREALALTQKKLDAARLLLAKAQNDRTGATIIAPMDGMVMEVNGAVGESAGTGALIVLANLEHPQIQVHIDETDLANFAVGCAAQITFDSLPGQTFTGIVTEIAPSLVTVQSVSMLEGVVNLEQATSVSGKTLPLGLVASSEITCHQTENALVIPAQALNEEQDQTAYVYVLNAQEQPEKRAVTVGIKTVALAEIQSGLQEGEQVIISQVDQP